jgi:predicted transport protein
MRIKTFVARLRRGQSIDKRLGFEEIKDLLEIKDFEKEYEEYMRPGLLYFTENIDRLAYELDVEKIYPKGAYIMGLYGGEEKRGEEKYAGIVLENYLFEDAIFRFRLSGIDKTLIAPKDLLKRYGVKIFRLVYIGEINPFRLRRFLDIILSTYGSEALKKFLSETLKINERDISTHIYRRVEKLIEEVRQPSTIKTLDMNKFYVVYRENRIFSSTVVQPFSDNIIIESNVSYVETKDEDKAYYYSAVLNYLAYKVIEFRWTFSRHQFARPLFAVHLSGLSWRDVDEKMRLKVVELSKRLHKKASDKEYNNQKTALKDLFFIQEFRELVKTLDQTVEKERLESSLRIVSEAEES